MTTYQLDENAPIYVEFELRPGAYQVSISPQEIAQKSAEALDKAMSTILQVAHRVIKTVSTLPQDLAQTEVEFGIKFNMETGAVIAKTGMEASINIKLTLKHKEVGDE